MSTRISLKKQFRDKPVIYKKCRMYYDSINWGNVITKGQGMDYIIFDLEWNQATGNHEKENRQIPFEIIEIGAVKLNSNREMVGEFSELIKPQIYKEIHYITSKLIHIQMEELEKGKPFLEVMKRFLEWCGNDCVFCTWGPLDLMELQRNMDFYHMEPLSDKPIKFYDIQKLFSLAYEDGKLRRSLEYAIDMMLIKKDIPFHRAFSDAYYTAKIFDKIEDPAVLEKFSFDTYRIPPKKEDEIYINFDHYNKYISRGFADKTKLLNDKEVMSSRCYCCNRALKKKIRWFTPNGKHYYSVVYCFRHGYTKCKLRIRKSDTGEVYAVKTGKSISHSEMKNLCDQLQKLKEAKKQRQKK